MAGDPRQELAPGSIVCNLITISTATASLIWTWNIVHMNYRAPSLKLSLPTNAHENIEKLDCWHTHGTDKRLNNSGDSFTSNTKLTTKQSHVSEKFPSGISILERRKPVFEKKRFHVNVHISFSHNYRKLKSAETFFNWRMGKRTGISTLWKPWNSKNKWYIDVCNGLYTYKYTRWIGHFFGELRV